MSPEVTHRARGRTDFNLGAARFMALKAGRSWSLYQLVAGAELNLGQHRSEAAAMTAALRSCTTYLQEPAPPCVNHLYRPSVTNLDGDELCQECATAWAKGEGDHAAWLEAQEREAADVG